jgi:hypothetical protein
MPEQLSKHPQVTLQVLQSAGAQCGVGAKQEILTACPPARFCKLPGGEVCVYGLPEAKQMTQVTASDWAALAPAAAPLPAPPAAEALMPWSSLFVALVVGVAVGWIAARRRRPRITS